MDIVQKSTPYHLQIYEILKEQILTGKIKSGERLLENKISIELGVSRSPVREALRMLQQDELIIINTNGLIVNPMEYLEMEEIYQCRIATEPYAAKLATKNWTKDDSESLKEIIEKAKQHHERKEFIKLVEANTFFHDSIVQKCNNSRLVAIIDKLRSLTILSRRAEFECYNRDDEYLVEHYQILEALTTKDGIVAEKALRNHIENDYKFFKDKFKMLY